MPPKQKTNNEGVDAGARRKVQRRSSGKAKGTNQFQNLGLRQTLTRQSNRHNEQGQNSVSSNSDSNLSVTHIDREGTNEPPHSLEIASRTKTIMESVTAAVLANLKTIGVLPNATPGSSSQIDDTQSSSGQSLIADRTDTNTLSTGPLGKIVPPVSNVAMLSSGSGPVTNSNSSPIVMACSL